MTALKDFLRSRNNTQNDAAKLLGISVASMSSKARGKRPFKQWEIKRIAEYYEMSNKELREVFFDGIK